METAERRAIRDQIRHDPVAKTGELGGRLRHHHDHFGKQRLQDRKRPLQQRPAAQFKKPFVPAHPTALAAGQEDPRDVGLAVQVQPLFGLRQTVESPKTKALPVLVWVMSSPPGRGIPLRASSPRCCN